MNNVSQIKMILLSQVHCAEPEGDEFQDVLIYGNIDSVCKAHEMVMRCCCGVVLDAFELILRLQTEQPPFS